MKALAFLLCLLFSSLAQAMSPVASCSWSAPGADRYRGDHVKALAAFGLPQEVHDRLAKRMTGPTLDFDEVVDIRRDSITGTVFEYEPGIGMMHFGSKGRVCLTVDRSMWKETDTERGLVYCDGQTCVLVPTVCGNVSLIRRRQVREVIEPSPVGTATAQTFAAEPEPVEGSFAALNTEYVYVPTYYTQTIFSHSVLPIPVLIENTTKIGAVSPVPEPSTWALMVVSVLTLALWKRKRHEHQHA